MSACCCFCKQKNEELTSKLEDVKYISRAKIVLMRSLGYTEEQSHRYIEKKAMDLRVSRRKVAVEHLRQAVYARIIVYEHAADIVRIGKRGGELVAVLVDEPAVYHKQIEGSVSHRYIEKKAMDLRVSRRKVAMDILKTYEAY